MQIVSRRDLEKAIESRSARQPATCTSVLAWVIVGGVEPSICRSTRSRRFRRRRHGRITVSPRVDREDRRLEALSSKSVWIDPEADRGNHRSRRPDRESVRRELCHDGRGARMRPSFSRDRPEGLIKGEAARRCERASRFGMVRSTSNGYQRGPQSNVYSISQEAAGGRQWG
jgi:hypothetical protein